MESMRKKEPPKLPNSDHVRKKRVFNQMSLSEIKGLISKKCGKTTVTKYGFAQDDEHDDVVIFLPMATREFETMIYWGELHPINRDEQLFEGIGHIFMDGNRRIIVVSHFLYIYAAERTPVSACIMKNGEFNSVMSRIEYEIEVYKKNEKRCNIRKDGTLINPLLEYADCTEPVMYCHTHPDLGCFFSPPDRVSGFATPNLPAVTFVADPVRKEMKAGVGIELNDAQILVYSYDNDSKSENDEVKTLPTKKSVDTEPEVNRDIQPVRAEELITEISKDCNKLLNPIYGAKGRFISHTTIGGAQKIKLEMKLQPEKKGENKTTKGLKNVGKSYDTYA